MGVASRGSLMRFKMSCYGWSNKVFLRFKCMYVFKQMIALCMVIRFRPTSRIVSCLYRQRTMEKRRTNEEVRSNELKQVSARKNQTKPVLNVISISFGLVCNVIQTNPSSRFFSLPNDKEKKKENMWQYLSFVVFRPKGLRLTCQKRRLESIYSCEKQLNSLTQIGAYITV